MTSIPRRDFLHGSAVLGVGVALGSYASARPAGSEPGYVFFDRAEAAFVEAAVDRLIPPEADWPGAREAGVPSYIDRQLAGPYGEGERLYLAGPIRPGMPGQGYQLGLTPAQLYRTSLAAIGEALGQRGLDFAAAPAGEQDAFLTNLERGRLRIADFPSSIFFETLLANTIEGWFADPAYGGNRDMVSWRMVGFPGAYAAYLDLYTRHGLHFTRPPLSMMDAGPHHHGAPADPSPRGTPPARHTHP